MNENLTKKIRNDFDRIALHEQNGWNHNNHYHSFLLKHLPSHCQTVVDIGCGTGGFSRLIANHATEILAIDLSPNMIEIAKQRSKEFSNINFQVINILKWQFPKSKFDAIVSIATLHHLPIESLLPNLKAALKPGGKLVILDLVENSNLRDKLTDIIAVPLNWLFWMSKNRDIKISPEATVAMREHLRTDKYLTLSQAKRIYTMSLTGAKVRKHLFWRYSVVWEK